MGCRTILFSSNLENANTHHARDLTVFLAGRGFKHGGYVTKAEDTPLCNLFVAMLHQTGLEAELFGKSTGELRW
jgi:hypothetical protein